MSKQMRELQARKSTLVKEARSLTDRAAADNRDMSDEEVSAFDALKARIESASAAIDREASLIAEEAQMAMHQPRSAHVTVTDNRQADPMHGFQSVGEFMQAVYQAEKPGKSLDDRLLIGGGRGAVAPGSFANEASGQDGGFLDRAKLFEHTASVVSDDGRDGAATTRQRLRHHNLYATTAQGTTGRQRAARCGHLGDDGGEACAVAGGKNCKITRGGVAIGG